MQEERVLDLIVTEGATNEELAAALGITERTAKFHTANLLKKIGAPNKLKLVASYWMAMR
jgi:DNA-binding CsgD family transcriptional regulator